MNSNIAPRGMVVTPHHLATQSAIAILREGGTAIEATVAAAATLAVVFPHMNSIGGDSFWLIVPPQGQPFVIEACGSAGSLASLNFYSGLQEIPTKGPQSANTVAGTVGGWEEALNYVTECGYQRISVSRLLADAIKYAEEGVAVTEYMEASLKTYVTEFQPSNEFKKTFIPNGTVMKVGDSFCQNNLADTLKNLGENGLNSFYTGDLANQIANDMTKLGMPITKGDLEHYTPIRRAPIRLKLKQGEVLNIPPPSQGIASLAILGILEKLDIDAKDEGQFIHVNVEATKQAFELRDKYITDPKYMKIDPQLLICDKEISKMAANVNLDSASTHSSGRGEADTVWMGVMDNKGFSVSFIQSVYQAFGSGEILPKTGILWQNRGISFSLDRNSLFAIKPGKKPLHTLNPAAAMLNDGRVMVYGTSGGDGQPQTQAAIFHRYVIQGIPLQKCISNPRWLYGRTTNKNKDVILKLENRFSEEVFNYLKEKGHSMVWLKPYDTLVGNAGALVRHVGGMMEGAFDVRSAGSAAGF